MAYPDPRHVLLVDDDLHFREILAQLLEESGYTVIQAEGGPAALRLLSASSNAEGAQALRDALPECLLITDYNMPDMTGAALIAQIQELGIEFERMMILSGNAFMQNVIDDAEKLGVELFDKSTPFKKLVSLLTREESATPSEDPLEEPT